MELILNSLRAGQGWIELNGCWGHVRYFGEGIWYCGLCDGENRYLGVALNSEDAIDRAYDALVEGQFN